MAKLPQPGRVKTRLTAAGPPNGLSPNAAAAVASAMLACTVERLAARWPVTLAVAPDGSGDALRTHLPPEIAVTIIDQGDGDLGARIDRAWRQMPTDVPVAVFGVDTPDVPGEELDAIPEAVAAADVVVGPTGDGGYWTLAAGRHEPAVLRGIDWGSARVYDQTRERTTNAGLLFHSLSEWPDVDHPEDLVRLRRRLERSDTWGAGDAAALHRLATVLTELAKESGPRT